MHLLRLILVSVFVVKAILVEAYRGGGYYRGGGGGGGYHGRAGGYRGREGGGYNNYASYRGARAVDGDTIRTRDGEYVRLRNVDAPELNQRGGHAARDSLQQRIDAGGHIERVATDVYGRTVGYVYDSHGEDVGQQQVEHGHGKRQ